MCQTPPATVGLPSNSGTAASTIGPSPFERSHSMLLGLRASLPKLPSFKVKRAPEPPKTEQLISSSRKRSNTESSDIPPLETKRRILDDVDSEIETNLENSSSLDRRPRTISRLEEEERSHSPLQLDDSLDVAPKATIVRSSEGNGISGAKKLSRHINNVFLNTRNCFNLWRAQSKYSGYRGPFLKRALWIAGNIQFSRECMFAFFLRTK